MLVKFLQLVHEINGFLEEVLYKKDILKNFWKFTGKHTVIWRCAVKKVFLKTSQNLHKKIFAGLSF